MLITVVTVVGSCRSQTQLMMLAIVKVKHRLLNIGLLLFYNTFEVLKNCALKKIKGAVFT